MAKIRCGDGPGSVDDGRAVDKGGRSGWIWYGAQAGTDG